MDLQRLLRPSRGPELPEAEMLRESAEDDLLARIVEDAGGARAATGVQANSRVPYATAKAENVLIDLFNNSSTASAFADTYMSQASERAAAIDSLGKELAADFASAKCDAIGLAAAAARIKRTHSNALALALGSDAVVRGLTRMAADGVAEPINGVPAGAAETLRRAAERAAPALRAIGSIVVRSILGKATPSVAESIRAALRVAPADTLLSQLRAVIEQVAVIRALYGAALGVFVLCG